MKPVQPQYTYVAARMYTLTAPGSKETASYANLHPLHLKHTVYFEMYFLAHVFSYAPPRVHIDVTKSVLEIIHHQQQPLDWVIAY